MSISEIEYRAWSIRGCARSADKPLRMEQQLCASCRSHLLRCSYQNRLIFMMISARWLAIFPHQACIKQPSSHEKCFVKYHVTRRGARLHFLTCSRGDVRRDFPNCCRASAPLCQGAPRHFTSRRRDFPATELQKASSLLLLIFFFCVLLTD